MKRPSRKHAQPITATPKRNGAKRSSARRPHIEQEYDRKFAQVRADIDRFAKAHPDFDRLSDKIEYLLRAVRLDLEEAYHLAAFIDCRARPPARLDAVKRALAKRG